MLKATTLYAAKDLVIDGVEVKKGDAVAVVASDVPFSRLSAGIQSGAFTRDDPAVAEPTSAPAIADPATAAAVVPPAEPAKPAKK